MPCPNDILWKSSTGELRLHSIGDMYLSNIIKMLERQASPRLAEMQVEQQRRDEHKDRVAGSDKKIERLTTESMNRINKRSAAFKRRQGR